MAKMIERCGECGFYSWKKHRCTRGATQESDPKAPYYDDCPLPDAEPVRHGRWETSFVYDWDGNKLYIHFHRECGFEYRNYLEDEHPYCPHCGVKMDGGDSNEG